MGCRRADLAGPVEAYRTGKKGKSEKKRGADPSGRWDQVEGDLELRGRMVYRTGEKKIKRGLPKS